MTGKHLLALAVMAFAAEGVGLTPYEHTGERQQRCWDRLGNALRLARGVATGAGVVSSVQPVQEHGSVPAKVAIVRRRKRGSSQPEPLGSGPDTGDANSTGEVAR